MPDLQDRLRGIAVGAAIGDALGMPLEFHPPRPEHTHVTEMIAGPLPAGSFTDDTEMALCLAESLLITSPLDARDLAGRFLMWYKSRPSDIGIHTSKVLSLIYSGVEISQASRRVQTDDPESASNGSVMRSWPLAIARHANPGLLAAETRIQTEITHTHPDCVNGTLLFNFVLYHILQAQATSLEAIVRQAILQASEQVALDPDFSMMLDLSALRQPGDLKNSGWVRHSLESTFWAVQTTRSFEEALVKVVNLGNDADTAGSMTGAVAGALYGLQNIPLRWRNALHGEYPIRSGHIWFENDLIHLADQLAAVAGNN
ncbi:MAG: ADP-ribosylglycohydrolase family protein [Anaerolineaceae bacterium]